MPVTRSKIQTTISFKQRKTRTSRKASVSFQEKDLKEPTVSRLQSQRSKSVPPSRQKLQSDTKHCSPRKSVHSSPRKRSLPQESDKENDVADVSHPCSPSKVPRSPLKATNRKSTGEENNIPTAHCSPSKSASKLSSPLRNLHRNESECYNNVKKSLHTYLPDRLLCRDKELNAIQTFLHQHIVQNKPGSLYISGAPGTGKTACVKFILEQDQKLKNKDVQAVFVNCMTVRQSQGIYNKILQGLGKGSSGTSAKDASKKLQRILTSKGNNVLLVLDEVDHLDCKGQEVLYTMFEWPSLPNSRLVLVGIANALDLTDRILPRLQARPRCAPKLLHFAPYTTDQIVTILLDRLQGSDEKVVEPMAVQLCARKVAAVAGDIRKALDVCRRAVEVVESDVRSQTLLKLKPTAPGSPRKSPSKSSPSKTAPKKVGPQTISSVLGEVYGSSMTSSGNSQVFPLQQKITICTLLLKVKEGKMKEITVGKLHETYCRVCSWKQVSSVDQSEFLSLLQLIETRGILGLKKCKDSRLSKVCLRLNEKDVEIALQDRVFMTSILQRGLANLKK